MNFETNIDICNGAYGKYEYNPNLGDYEFIALGTAAYLKEIAVDMETGEVTYQLSFHYLNTPKTLVVSRADLMDRFQVKKLAANGVDVTSKTFNSFVDSIRLQEQDAVTWMVQTHCSYSHLGWLSIPDKHGLPHPQYRANTLIGGKPDVSYTGQFLIAPMGNYDDWWKVVVDDVVGQGTIEIVLVAALSAVTNGILSLFGGTENAIIHICGPSGQGKSTGAFLGVSVAGQPFHGKRTMYDRQGNAEHKVSLLQTWGATDTEILAGRTGNRGVVTVLDEFGKYTGKHLDQVIFNLSEGTDKARSSVTLQSQISEGYSTTVLSFGESSLLERCSSKLEGLRVRVMELEAPLTKSAEQSRRIKEVCRANNGFAGPMLAEYIIDHGGYQLVKRVYNAWLNNLPLLLPQTQGTSRFSEKFYALFLATAEIAEKALGIPFDIYGMLAFFEQYETVNASSRNSSADSYEIIVEECNRNKHKFYARHDTSLPFQSMADRQVSVPSGECWGRLTYMRKPFGDRVVGQEYEVFAHTLEDLLLKNGFPNKKTCISAWKAAGVLDFQDEQHPCRRRLIDVNAQAGTANSVYVLRVFCTPEDTAKYWEERRKQDENGARRSKLARRKSLLDEEDPSDG